jgi:hypothetical protein
MPCPIVMNWRFARASAAEDDRVTTPRDTARLLRRVNAATATVDAVARPTSPHTPAPRGPAAYDLVR